MAEIELKNCVDGNEDPDCFYCQNDVQHAKCEKKSKDIEDSTRKRGKPKMKSCKSCFAEIPLVQHFKHELTCGKTSSSNKTKRKSEAAICQFCQKTLSDAWSLKRHVNRFHEEEVRNFESKSSEKNENDLKKNSGKKLVKNSSKVTERSENKSEKASTKKSGKTPVENSETKSEKIPNTQSGKVSTRNSFKRSNEITEKSPEETAKIPTEKSVKKTAKIPEQIPEKNAKKDLNFKSSNLHILKRKLEKRETKITINSPEGTVEKKTAKIPTKKSVKKTAQIPEQIPEKNAKKDLERKSERRETKITEKNPEETVEKKTAKIPTKKSVKKTAKIPEQIPEKNAKKDLKRKSERRERKITEKDSPEEDPPKKKIRISTGKPTKKIQELPENIPDDKNERRKSLIFECQYCKESVSRNGKVNHEAFCFKYHKILKGNQCLICQRDFANRKAIRNHMNGVHKDVNPDNEETMNGEVLEACKSTVQDNKENIAQENPEKGDETENQEDDKEPEEPNNDLVDEDAKDDINEETDQEDELSFDNVEEVTQDNYEAFDTSEGMETKDQGDVIEDEVIEPDMTNAGETTPDDLDTSYLCATCRKTSFTDEQDFQNHECIRNEVNHNFIPMIKYHRGNTSSVGKGPELIEKVYKCPICQGKLLKARQVMEHMALFHRISFENQKRMKLRICEVNIATL